jgi:hypothetical protein
MLNTSYSVGTAPYALVFTKQFDTENKSAYSVGGLPASAARLMSVQSQIQKDKSSRHLVDTSYTHGVPDSTSGATYVDRVYTVIQRSPYTSEADIMGHIATHADLLAESGFLASVLNHER